MLLLLSPDTTRDGHIAPAPYGSDHTTCVLRAFSSSEKASSEKGCSGILRDTFTTYVKHKIRSKCVDDPEPTEAVPSILSTYFLPKGDGLLYKFPTFCARKVRSSCVFLSVGSFSAGFSLPCLSLIHI